MIILLLSSTRLVLAPSGTFFLGSSTTYDEIWTSSSPKHVTVTVTVTSAMGDTYADESPTKVTVNTDNYYYTLHNGETKTFEDSSTSNERLSETPGYDHNGYSYYGISGNWEVTVVGGGGNGGGGSGLGDLQNWLMWGIVAAVIIALVAALALLLIKRRHTENKPPPPPPPPPADSPAK